MANLKLRKDCNLLLVEGADEEYFFIWACCAYGLENIQVLNFGGIEELTKFLKTLRNLPGFDDVGKLLIIRDAENDAQKAEDDIKKALNSAEFSVASEAFQFRDGMPHTAFGLLPGTKHDVVYDNGTLEDLCLKLICDESRLDYAEDYISKINENVEKIKYWHKSRLHAYLAGKNKFVGMKIGEAAKAGAWNWNSQYMKIFKDALLVLNENSGIS